MKRCSATVRHRQRNCSRKPNEKMVCRPIHMIETTHCAHYWDAFIYGNADDAVLPFNSARGKILHVLKILIPTRGTDNKRK